MKAARKMAAGADAPSKDLRLRAGPRVVRKPGVAVALSRTFEKLHPTEREQERLVKGFENERMRSVRVTKTRIEGTYDGRHLSYPVKGVEHMKNIGNWRHTPRDKTIVIDWDVKPNERAGVLVHEAVEQYLQKEYGLPYRKAHYLATRAERFYVESRGGNWRSHEISVFKTRT